jgi:transposase-like protein
VVAKNTASVGLVNIQDLVDDASGYRKVRELRWAEGVRCPFCGGEHIIKHGCDETQEHRQRYHCQSCGRYFDDLTGTIFGGHHQPCAYGYYACIPWG